jgi:hypothetical protein
MGTGVLYRALFHFAFQFYNVFYLNEFSVAIIKYLKLDIYTEKRHI